MSGNLSPPVIKEKNMGVSLFRRSLVTAVAVSGLMGATVFAQE